MSDVPVADVVAPDDEDVRLLLLGFRPAGATFTGLGLPIVARRAPAEIGGPHSGPPGPGGGGRALEALATALRALPVPVVGRVAEGALVLDLRCLGDEQTFVQQLGALRLARTTGER